MTIKQARAKVGQKKLKACPFCGEYPELRLCRDGYYRIECRSLYCATRLTASILPEDIIDVWNTRMKSKPREKEDETS